MKKYLLLLFCFLSYTTHSIADPFYGKEQEKENIAKATIAKKRAKKTACELPENANIVNIPIEFEDLKLVGVLKYNNTTKALFIDKSNQIFDFAQDDFIKDKTKVDIIIFNFPALAISKPNFARVKRCSDS